MMPADAKSITQELNKICEAWAVADGRAGSNLIDASDRLTHLEIYATVQRTLMEAAVRMGEETASRAQTCRLWSDQHNS